MIIYGNFLTYLDNLSYTTVFEIYMVKLQHLLSFKIVSAG